MGKRIISQRRGRGTPTYRAHSFNYKGLTSYPKLEQKMMGKITNLFHDPGRTAPLAKIRFNNITLLLPAPEGVKVNQNILCGDKNIKIGNIIPLLDIPIGTEICNIEKAPGSGPSFCKSSGAKATVVNKGNKITLQFKTKKQKKFNPNCRAMVGIIAGSGRKEKPFVKAGKRYHAMKARGKLYPRTSGVAMNAVDHPFGSGRGRHMGKPKTVSRRAPPGRKVGLISPKRTGKKK